MKIPEIDRDLQHTDPRVRYWIKYQQEQINAIQQQIDQAAELLLKFYQVLSNIQQVNIGLREGEVEKVINKIQGKDQDPNMVQSVLNHPDDED